MSYEKSKSKDGTGSIPTRRTLLISFHQGILWGKKKNNFEEMATEFHTPDYAAALHAQYATVQEQLMRARTASRHLDLAVKPCRHFINMYQPLLTRTSLPSSCTFPLFCTPSPYNPSFCFFTRGNTPMSTIPAVTMTAHSCIFSVPLLKSVCVAAATVARLSTSSTYPLIRWYFHTAFALSTPP